MKNASVRAVKEKDVDSDLSVVSSGNPLHRRAKTSRFQGYG